jgi:hypothetical protein
MPARTRRNAVALVVPEEFLNRLAARGVGDGIAAPVLRNTFHLPMMGPLEMSVWMTIVGVSFQMRAGDGGRLRATVRATGAIEFHGDTPMPSMPGLARVAGEVLVDPIVERRPDGSFVAQLDLPGSELLSMTFEGFDGIDSDGDAQAQMSQMLFGAVGGELFEGLANALGAVGIELTPEEADRLDVIGVGIGPAHVRVLSGRIEVALVAVDALEGDAPVVRVDGARVGVGVASGVLSGVIAELASGTWGGALPYELDASVVERSVDGRIRSTRLVDSPLLPDLRPGLRYRVEPRLLGDRLELALRAAWLELPLVPPVINQFNRWLGGVAARVPEQLVGPLAIRLPATVNLPVRPGTDQTMAVTVAGLKMVDGGVEIVIETDL